MKLSSHVNWGYIILGYAGLLAYGMVDNMRGPFYPDLISSMGLNQERGALFFVTASFAAFVTSALVSRRATGFSFVWGIRLGLLSMGAGSLTVSGSESWNTVLVGAGLVGIGFGSLSVYQNIAVQAGSSPENRRRLFSGLQSMYALSSLAAPLAASLVVTAGGDWRWGLRLVALAPIGVMLASFVFAPPTIVPSVPRQESRNLCYSRLHAFWLAWILGAYVSAEILVSTRLPLVLRSLEGVSPSGGAMGLAIFFGLLLLGRATFTFYRFQSLSNKQVLAGSLVLSLSFLLLGVVVSPWWLPISGLSMAPFFAVVVDYHVEAFGDAVARPLAMNVAFSSLAVVVMHYGMGWLSERYGLKMALLVAPAAISLSLFLLLTEGWVLRRRQVIHQVRQRFIASEKANP